MKDYSSEVLGTGTGGKDYAGMVLGPDKVAENKEVLGRFFNSEEARANREMMMSPEKWPAYIKDSFAELFHKPGATEWDATRSRIVADLGNPNSEGFKKAINIALSLGTVTPTRAIQSMQGRSVQVRPENRAAADIVGGPATSGQLARDPDLMRFEVDQAGRSSPETAPLRRVFDEQNTALVTRARGLAEQTGGTPNAYEAGKNVVGAIEAKQAEALRSVRAAYEAAKGDGAAVITKNLEDFFSQNRAALNAVPNLRAAFSYYRKMLDPRKFKAMTVDELEQMAQFVGKVTNRSDPLSRYWGGQVKGAIDDAVLGAGSGPVYREARLAKQLERSEFADQKIIAKLLDKLSSTDRKVKYEDVWDEVVKDIDGLKQVKNVLATSRNPEAWNDIKAQTMENLISRSQPGVQRGLTGESVWSAAGYKRALDSIGDDKLRIIFTPEELTVIRAMQRFGEMRIPPPSSAVTAGYNTSGTAASLINYMDRLASVPGLGRFSLLWQKISNVAERRALEKNVRMATNPDEFFGPAAGGQMEAILPQYRRGGGTKAAGVASQVKDD